MSIVCYNLGVKSKRKIIIISGPTASGKTGFGVEIAKKFNGEIISADSRQVYRGLDIGTGKDLAEYGEIKYHLIDICDPGERFTMFDWLKLAREAIEDIFSRGKTPIVVGGTGLYIQALVEGFEIRNEKLEMRGEKLGTKDENNKSKIKNQNDKSKVKNFSRADLESKSLDELQKISSNFSFPNSNLDVNNSHRLIRAIEKAQSGEKPTKVKPDFEVLQIAVDLPREILYQRIDARCELWFVEGFCAEIQNLLDRGVDPEWLEKIGLEYRILTEYLIQKSKTKNQNDKEKCKDDSEFLEMKQQMKYAIHAFARRQLTWFRRFPEIIWLNDLKSAEKAVEKFLLY